MSEYTKSVDEIALFDMMSSPTWSKPIYPKTVIASENAVAAFFRDECVYCQRNNGNQQARMSEAMVALENKVASQNPSPITEGVQHVCHGHDA